MSKSDYHEWTYRIQCEYCGAGFSDRKHDREHKC